MFCKRRRRAASSFGPEVPEAFEPLSAGDGPAAADAAAAAAAVCTAAARAGVLLSEHLAGARLVRSDTRAGCEATCGACQRRPPRCGSRAPPSAAGGSLALARRPESGPAAPAALLSCAAPSPLLAAKAALQGASVESNSSMNG